MHRCTYMKTCKDTHVHTHNDTLCSIFPCWIKILSVLISAPNQAPVTQSFYPYPKRFNTDVTHFSLFYTLPVNLGEEKENRLKKQRKQVKERERERDGKRESEMEGEKRLRE